MIKDRNKGISTITYNHLNLPTEIKFEGTNNKITYLYPDAFGTVGQKLKKTVVYSDSIKIVDYLDGFQTEARGLRIPKKRRSHKTNNNEQNHTATLASFDLEILNFQSLTRPFGLKHSEYSAGRLRDFEVDFSNPEDEHVFLTPVTKTEYQYKYNGQEWQDELGLNMYAMDLRQYDPAIGRWVAQDPVTHFDYSPYNAFDNNPVFWADPSGADAVDIGYDRIVDSQDLMGSYHWSGGFQEIENEGGGETKSQQSNNNYPDVDWSTFEGYDPTISLDEVLITDMSQLEGALEQRAYEALDIWSNWGRNSSYYGWTGFNGVLGSASGYTTWKSGYLKSNELWHKTKTNGYSNRFQSKWNNPGAKYWRGQYGKTVQGTRNLNSALTKVGAVALIADVAMSGELKPSHGINTFMIGISGTGVGSIVAGVWFLADYGTGAYNYFFTNDGFRTLSDVIDQSVGTYEMYEGLY